MTIAQIIMNAVLVCFYICSRQKISQIQRELSELRADLSWSLPSRIADYEPEGDAS